MTYQTKIIPFGPADELAARVSELLDQSDADGWELVSMSSVPAGQMIVHRHEVPGRPFVALPWEGS
jgi:hypothetical protein